jgi:hypothetical protein
VAFYFTGNQVPRDHTPGLTIYQHNIHYFGAGVHFYLAGSYLTAQRAVGTKQQLLTSLTTGVEGT